MQFDAVVKLIGGIVAIVTPILGSVFWIQDTFAKEEDVAELSKTLMQAHQIDFFQSREDYLTDEIKVLETQKIQRPLVPIEEDRLSEMRDELIRIKEKKANIIRQITE